MSVAFVGAGPRAVTAARVLVDSGAGTIAGFTNRTASVADRVAADFSVPSFPSATALITTTRPDLVAVLTHPVARADVIAESVGAGAEHLLVEKPLALSESELAAIEDAAGERFLAVNTQYQWMPHWQRLLGLVADGALGEIREIRAGVGVNALEQGPHGLSLAMAAAAAAGLPDPTWVIAGGAAPIRFGEVSLPSELTALFDLGEARLSLTAGDCAPRVPGETNRFFQQQTEIVGSRGSAWVSLNQGARLRIDGEVRSEVTAWPRDDVSSQAGLFHAIARAVAESDRQAGFPTRLGVAAAQARMLFGAVTAAQGAGRVRLRS